MANANHTKHALLTSLLALVLCFTMLLGTTYAWFTDSVESGKNKIVAGNLDVELYHQDKGTNNADVKVDGNTTLFDDVTPALWEPGAMAWEKLTVANEGSLALKYQLALNVLNATVVDGVSFTTVLKVAQVAADFTYTRENVEKIPAADWSDLASFTMSGELAAGGKQAYGIVIWWQPSANDNLFNMNNGKTPGSVSVEVGVTLNATQLSAEEDSFGPDYDENAVTQVTDAAGLQNAINSGATQITLLDDIVLDGPITIPATAATFSLRRAAAPAITIDLNGKTITGTSAKDAGAVIMNYGNAVITGGTVKNVTNNGDATINNAGSLVLDDVIVEGAPIADGDYPSYAIMSSGNLTIEEGTTVRSDRGCLRLSGTGETVINGGVFANNDIGDRTLTSHVVYVENGANNKLTIYNGTFQHLHTNTSGGVVINNRSAVTVDVKGGSFSGGKYYGIWDNLSDYGSAATKTPFSVTGGTFTGFDDHFLAEGYTKIANADGTYTVLKGNVIADNSAALDNALASGEKDVALGAGEFTMPGTTGDVTISGTKDTVITIDKPTANKVTLNGVTVVSGYYQGIQHSDTVIYENCTIKGTQFLYANTVIIKNCTIDLTEFADYIWTYSAKNVTFDNCTFHTKGKAILIYHEGADTVTNVTVKNCTFNATASEGKGAIEIDSHFAVNGHYTLTTENNTYDATYFTGEWRVKDASANNTTVNGASVVTTNDGLKAAVASGATTILLMNGEYDLNGNQKDGLTLVGLGDDVKMANTTRFAGGKAVGAICHSLTLENMTVTNTVYTMENGGQATFNDVYFAAGVRQAYGASVVFNRCVFGSNAEGYALHFQTDSISAGSNIVLNDCTFEGGKVHLGGKRTYTFTGCTFAEGTDFQVWSNITLDNCTVNGVKVTADNVATLFPKLDVTKVTFQ